MGKIAHYTVAALMLLLVPFFAHGEIELKYYQEDQANAPEYIEIKVLDVDKEWCLFCPEREIRIKARVLTVHRSASDLQKGEIIKIVYMRFKPPKKWAGPRPLPLLKEKRNYPAFLKRVIRKKKKKRKLFKPAARGYSFGPVLAGSH